MWEEQECKLRIQTIDRTAWCSAVLLHVCPPLLIVLAMKYYPFVQVEVYMRVHVCLSVCVCVLGGGGECVCSLMK